MNESIIQLSYLDLAIAALFLALPAFLSLRRGLGIHRDLAVGALRCFGQLIAMGYLIRFIFDVDAWWLVLGWLGVMVLFGGRIATQRQSHPIPGAFRLSVFSIGVTAFLTLAFVTVVIIEVEPWYDPQYLIPLAGMIIGNAMNGSALALERLDSEMRLRRAQVEVALALGATPRQASADAVRATVRASLIPTINQLMSVGLVHLPGIMTGQILSGTSPVTAVRYQILIMYMLTFVTAATAILVTGMGHRRFFSERMQLVLAASTNGQS